jgi:hypothetical protein
MILSFRSDDPPLPPLLRGGAESGGIFLEFASFLTLSSMKILGMMLAFIKLLSYSDTEQL